MLLLVSSFLQNLYAPRICIPRPCPAHDMQISIVSSLGSQGCQRSWQRLRLVTEQGKLLALNSERIASLYGVEGYRLAPIRYS